MAAFPSLPAPRLDRSFDQARLAYEAGRAQEALTQVQAVLQRSPRHGDACFLEGLCLIDLGRAEEAEGALRSAIGLNRKDPARLTVLADLLRRPTRLAEAEKLYRTALAINWRFPAAVAGLAQLLTLLERHEEALRLTTPLAAGTNAPVAVLEAHAQSLKLLDRFEEALAVTLRAAQAGSASSRIDVANILRELGRTVEAEEWARQSLHSFDFPAAHLVHARTLQENGRLLAAEAACQAALAHAPFDDRAHEHLAELRFRRTGDPEEANTDLDAALGQRPIASLLLLKARLLSRDKRHAEAHDLLARATRAAPGDVALQAGAAKAALKQAEVDKAYIDVALGHAEAAHASAFDLPKISALLAEAALAAGQAERASQIVARLLRTRQSAALIALQAVAWRMLGDARYGDLYDYARVVGSFMIEPPKGWTRLDSFLSDLAAALDNLHDLPAVPGAGQRRDLPIQGSDVIAGFYAALEEPVRAYLSSIGRGKDFLRRRNEGGWRVSAAWSIRSVAGNCHGNHLHPTGWLSSAFYVTVPPAATTPCQGWIKFGEPGLPTRSKLKAEHWVQPEPGRFLLFPSYMWHGTEPFAGDGDRLVISVDFLPTRQVR